MNKNYWNEHRERYINKDVEKKILKAYQYSLPKKKYDLGEKISLLELNCLKKPDIYLYKIEISEIPSKAIKDIFFKLKDYIKNNTFIYCLPVINISKNFSQRINAGTYLFDIEENALLKLNSKTIEDDTEKSGPIKIFWLLDITAAICLYNRSGLLNGIKHTITVKNEVCHDINHDDYPILLQQQYLLKKIDLNPRELLLIDSIYIIE